MAARTGEMAVLAGTGGNRMDLNPNRCLPVDHERALLVGRIWSPAVDGPILVRVKADGIYDLSTLAATMS
jgi:fumarylacetoacetate (FAA) hydrolase family protein